MLTYDTLQKTNNKGADQAARMRRLIRAFAVRQPPKTGFLAKRPIFEYTKSSGQTALMCRLVRAFAAHRYDVYQKLTCWPIQYPRCSHLPLTMLYFSNPLSIMSMSDADILNSGIVPKG